MPGIRPSSSGPEKGWKFADHLTDPYFPSRGETETRKWKSSKGDARETINSRLSPSVSSLVVIDSGRFP